MRKIKFIGAAIVILWCCSVGLDWLRHQPLIIRALLVGGTVFLTKTNARVIISTFVKSSVKKGRIIAEKLNAMAEEESTSTGEVAQEQAETTPVEEPIPARADSAPVNTEAPETTEPATTSCPSSSSSVGEDCCYFDGPSSTDC